MEPYITAPELFDKQEKDNQNVLRLLEECNFDIKSSLQKCLELTENLKSIEETSTMSKVLMSDLLDFAQLEHNAFRVNEIYFDLIEIIQKAINIVRHGALEKNILIKFNVEATN